MLIRFFNVCLWLSGIAIFCFVWGFLIEPTQLKTRHHTINIPPLEKPVKLAFLSDLHIGGEHVPAKRVNDIIRQVMNEAPDIIIMGGDFVDGHDKPENQSDRFNNEIQQGLKWLSGLEAPLGVYATLGNHDDWYDSDVIRNGLEASGITVLENQVVSTGGVCLAGLEDEWTGHPDPSVIEKCPEGIMIMAIMHSPDSFENLPARTSLALAGHTHGGQINLPILGRHITATKIGKPYAYGLKSFGGFPVYITSGIGTSMLPARFRAPPEIVILQLRSVEP